jgi:hypothetical protein
MATVQSGMRSRELKVIYFGLITGVVISGLLSARHAHSHDYVIKQEFSGVLRKGGFR